MLRKYQGYSWESRTNPTRTQKTLQLWINVSDSPVEPRATVSNRKGVFDLGRGCEGSYQGRLISTLMAGKIRFRCADGKHRLQATLKNRFFTQTLRCK
jgi:hypothetical protein